MASEDAGANRTRWALVFALLASILAGLAHAVLSYFTVTGFTLDWMTWEQRPRVATEVVAGGLGFGIFVTTLLLAGVAGAATWALAQRGRVRGEDDGREHDPTSWSEFSFFHAAGIAATMGVFAAVLGFLAAELVDPVGLDGPVFFLVSVAFGALAAFVGAFTVASAVADAHASGRIVRENPEGNVVSRVQLWSAENATMVVTVTLLIVAASGFGITKIDTDVDVADLLPRGNENTTAAKDVSREFKSTFTQQVTFQLKKNPEQCWKDARRVLGADRASDVDCHNITAEPYVRAMEEIYLMALAEEDNPIEYTIGINSFYKLINWTIAGGQDAPPSAFSLPPVEDEEDPTQPAKRTRYQSVNRTVWTAIPSLVTPIIDPSFDQAASLYLVPPSYNGTSKNIGNQMLDFRDDYVQEVENGGTTWKIWGEENPPLFTVDIPVANAHQSELAEEDFATLFPLIFGFIVVALYFSFRNFTAIGMAGATLLNAALITYGLMGWMDIPLNTLNLTVLPLILGNGIDYAIHQTTEFAHHKREGYTDTEALHASGSLAGFAMFIATATSVSGLLVMTISPSLLMAEVGLLAAVAMTSVYLLIITFMPAVLALAPTSDAMGRKFEGSGLVVQIARGVSRNRVLVGTVLVVLTAGAFVGMQHLTIEEFGEPAQNFPEDDPLRHEHEDGLHGFYNLDARGAEELKANIMVFRGDNTDLQSHRYMDALQDAMRERENVDLSTSRTVPDLIRSWLIVKDGAPGAAEQVGRNYAANCNPPDPQVPTAVCPGFEAADNYPQTREDIISELDASFASPLSTFGSLFANHPTYNITIMPFSTTTGDFEDAEAAWDDVWASVEDVEDQKPHDLEVAFVGNTALNYLFITEELPWLSYLGFVSGAVLLTLAAVFTKRLRAVIAVGLVLGLTSTWWLGLLPAFDIGLAITLMLPAVFITSIGSDYAIHMTWNMRRNPDRAEVYGVVGKAILFSAITDMGAFAIFTQTQNVAASRAMLATVIAIGIMFVVTILVMPILYPLSPTDTEAKERDVDAIPDPAAASPG